jgi:hypothetical protein
VTPRVLGEPCGGGEYRISIIGEMRKPARAILERARALKRPSGSVRVRQVDTDPAAPVRYRRDRLR